MNRQAKKEFYANLDPTEIGNSKKFWKTFKPIFTQGTVNNNEKIGLVEDGRTLHGDKTIGECFNSYFVNITDTLDLPEETISAHEDVTHEDPVLQAINKYQHHPSIQMVKQNVVHLAEEDIFVFSHFNPVSVWNEINQLNNTKKTSGEVSISSLKMVSDIYYQEITRHMNKSIESCEFPDKLKQADVSPIFKNDDGTNKKNYRPISVLSALSKVFERQISQQMTPL